MGTLGDPGIRNETAKGLGLIRTIVAFEVSGYRLQAYAAA
jgi:hypothetical protein